MAKDSTSNAVGAKGWRMELPVWDGKAESLEEYAGNVELLVLGTKVDDRIFLGPQLVAALPHGSSQRKLAMRLPRDDSDSESIATKAEGDDRQVLLRWLGSRALDEAHWAEHVSVDRGRGGRLLRDGQGLQGDLPGAH